MLPVTPSPGLPGQPEQGGQSGPGILHRRASASFSSSNSSTSSENEHHETEGEDLAAQHAKNARRRVSLADEANLIAQAQAQVDAAEEAEVEKDPGCLKKVIGTRLVLREVVRTRPFLLTVALIITANAVYMGIEVDANSGIEVDSSQSVDQPAWAAVEIMFTFIFLVELTVRFIATIPVKRFFKSAWNLFDLLIVAVSIVDNILVIILRNTTEIGSFSVLRSLRLIRVIRVFGF